MSGLKGLKKDASHIDVTQALEGLTKTECEQLVKHQGVFQATIGPGQCYITPAGYVCYERTGAPKN